MEKFCGTGKGFDEKEKHNNAWFVPAKNVQNGKTFDLIFVQITLINPKYVDNIPIW